MTTTPAADADDAPAPAADADDAPAPAAERRSRRRFRYTLPGAWVALLFGCLSFTPSLLPRGPITQGVVLGVSAAIGYGLGVVGAWVWRAFADREARSPRTGAWRAFWIVAALALLASLVAGLRWQAQIRELMGTAGYEYALLLLLPVVAAAVFTLLVAVGRLLRKLYLALSRLLNRWVGRRAARAVGWATVVAATWLLVSGVLVDGFFNAANEAFSVRNTITPDGVEQPTSPLRSGSQASLVSWDSLGREGRVFTGQGPDAAAITEVTGEAAVEPVRIFAGLDSADSTEARAALAVADLERAGGFDRDYLVVVTSTGSGWVSPGSIETLEYLSGGDVATISMQYSFLPSWISFLVDQKEAQDAGRTLFDTVYREYNELPLDDRPQLLLFGESLGSFGAESAFSGEFDLANRTDGVLLTGPPNFNVLYRQFVDSRDEGTPEVLPVYRDGRIVRFANGTREPIGPSGAPWDDTRVLYVQHPSDPIVWWSPSLVLNRPDWLEEPPGEDVLEEMVWLPFVTFWQVTADLPLAAGVPPGHGHLYTTDYVDGWLAVLQTDGWDEERVARLKAAVEE